MSGVPGPSKFSGSSTRHFDHLRNRPIGAADPATYAAVIGMLGGDRVRRVLRPGAPRDAPRSGHRDTARVGIESRVRLGPATKLQNARKLAGRERIRTLGRPLDSETAFPPIDLVLHAVIQPPAFGEPQARSRQASLHVECPERALRSRESTGSFRLKSRFRAVCHGVAAKRRRWTSIDFLENRAPSHPFCGRLNEPFV
jgi:hypothetical protein